MVDPKIRTFLALLQTGSYTKAAQALSLTQPAVSHHIKQLESDYGVRIFYPRRKPLTLTPEGKILERYARRIVALSVSAQEALNNARAGVIAFSVGVTTTATSFVVSRVIAEYCDAHPDIRMHIFTDSINNIYEKLRSYEYDWAIVEGTLPAERIHSILLSTDYLCLVVSPNHRLAKIECADWDMLKQERFILRGEAAGTRQMLEGYLETHALNIRDFNIVIETDSVSTIKTLVMQNFGVSILANSVCREEIARGDLVAVPIIGYKPMREINLAYHIDFQQKEMLQEIRQLYQKNLSSI